MYLSRKVQKAPKDVFHAFLVEKAHYAGVEEMPFIRTSHELQQKLLPFDSEFAIAHKGTDGDV